MRTTRESPGAIAPSTQCQLSMSSLQVAPPAFSESSTATPDLIEIHTATSPVACVPSERTVKGIS